MGLKRSHIRMKTPAGGGFASDGTLQAENDLTLEEFWEEMF